MKNKYITFLSLVVALFYIASCTVPQQPAVTPPKAEDKQPPPVPVPAPPVEQPQPMSEITADVSDLLAKSKTRVQNIYYLYKGHETGDNFYAFYVKGAKIMYKPSLAIKSLDNPESYDSIFIDKTAQTSQSYCVHASCVYKGKKQDLNYEDAYISTPFDWTSGLTSAKKVGEEVIDSRSTWKIETNKGFLWVDTFYGIPLQAESNGNIYRFTKISVNSVQDSDVTHS
ncbi:hypothetical protein HYW20_04120 [Candidatus Woesearchaeota archaeon]|nr:hypothetical protein [Candidatus Woesearchaeota archaeon]